MPENEIDTQTDESLVNALMAIEEIKLPTAFELDSVYFSLSSLVVLSNKALTQFQERLKTEEGATDATAIAEQLLPALIAVESLWRYRSLNLLLKASDNVFGLNYWELIWVLSTYFSIRFPDKGLPSKFFSLHLAYQKEINPFLNEALEIQEEQLKQLFETLKGSWAKIITSVNILRAFLLEPCLMSLLNESKISEILNELSPHLFTLLEQAPLKKEIGLSFLDPKILNLIALYRIPSEVLTPTHRSLIWEALKPELPSIAPIFFQYSSSTFEEDLRSDLIRAMRPCLKNFGPPVLQDILMTHSWFSKEARQLIYAELGLEWKTFIEDIETFRELCRHFDQDARFSVILKRRNFPFGLDSDPDFNKNRQDFWHKIESHLLKVTITSQERYQSCFSSSTFFSFHRHPRIEISPIALLRLPSEELTQKPREHILNALEEGLKYGLISRHMLVDLFNLSLEQFSLERRENILENLINRRKREEVREICHFLLALPMEKLSSSQRIKIQAALRSNPVEERKIAGQEFMLFERFHVKKLDEAPPQQISSPNNS